MIKKLSLFILLVLLTSGSAIQAQETKSEEEPTAKDLFLKEMTYLMADGGVWETENPNFKEDEQYSAKTYKYKMSKGIHGEQFRIGILSDINSVGWWTSWDSYFLWHPFKKQGIYHGVGASGSTADGRLYVAEAGYLVNIFEVFTYEGIRSVHKDVFIKVDENIMKSKAYELNEKGEWQFYEELEWKRVQES